MILELATVGFLIGTYVYHRYIEDHQPPALPSQLTVPRSEEGVILPLVYGTSRVRAPVLAWSGNYINPGDSIATSIGSWVAGSYSYDGLFIVGVPFSGGTASLINVFLGDTPVSLRQNPPGFDGGVLIISGGALVQPQFGTVSSHDSPNLLLSGVFYGGSTTQDITDHQPSGFLHHGMSPLAFNDNNRFFFDRVFYSTVTIGIGGTPIGTSALAAMEFAGQNRSFIPGYREQIAAFVHFGLGQSSSAPSISFEVRACGDGVPAQLSASWNGATEADPAAVLLDLLTGRFGKLNLPIAMIDMSSFTAASNTLFAEGNGYSRTIEQPMDASALIAEIMKQIDGVYYQEPTTGKIVLKLFRKDYNIDDLDDINPSNALDPSSWSYAVQGWAELPNQVVVSYTERANHYNTATVTAQSPAGIAVNGGRLRSLSLSFPGCCTAQNAQRIASRELAAVSRPLAKATVRVTRSLYQKRIGDVVTLTWPELGIFRMVMRIVRVNRGRPGNSALTLDLIRDVFDVTRGAFPRP